MEKSKISIIIPIYNSELYIENTVDSILNQNYKNLEIILINDGSKDHSLDICKKIAKKDKRVIVVDQKNRGVAFTRNRGLELASGDYIFFLDNDDLISNDFIETFVRENDNDYDIIIGGYIRETYEGKKLFKRSLINDDIAPYIQLACWGKMFKASFIKKYNFLDSKIADDFYFNVLAYNDTDKIKVIDYCGYHWMFNDKSLSNNENKKLNYTKDLIKVLEKINNEVKLNDTLVYFYLRTIIYYLLFSCKKVKYEKIKEAYNYMFNWLKGIDSKYYKNKYIGIFKKNSEEFSVKFAIKGFLLLQRMHLIKIFLLIYSKI